MFRILFLHLLHLSLVPAILWGQSFQPPTASPSSEAAIEVNHPVVLIERPSVVNKFTVDTEGVRAMFVLALQNLTGQKNVGVAWQQLGIKSSDVVGLKIDAAPGPIMGTRRALVDAVVETLTSAGVKPENIIIWDKFSYELESAGWLPQREGELPLVKGVIPETGFDGQEFYVDEILGRLIWGDYLFHGRKPSREELLKAAEKVAKKHSGDPTLGKNESDINAQTSNKSYFAKLLTKDCTKIVNLPVMTDHGYYGLEGCLSSLAIGSVDNSRRFANDGVNGDPEIAEILDRDLFRKKVVLHILDGLIAQYAGGPQFVPLYTKSIGALYLSKDPVAIDSLVLARMEDWRKEVQVVPIKEIAKHVATAGSMGLGEHDLTKIKLTLLK